MSEFLIWLNGLMCGAFAVALVFSLLAVQRNTRNDK